jgi:pimeloyl-ACP methyl ester carboxylesterase
MTQTIDRITKSTIVRIFAAPWPVRAAFRTLERVAPAIGARWAERLWMTLPASSQARRPGAAGGARFDYPGGGVGEVWGDGPPIYLVHGWAGHRGQFSEFVRPLLASGYRVVAFDMPSHGDSAPGAFGPRSSTFPEFTAALGSVVERFGPPHAIVAHSAGAIATASALCDGMTAQRLVLLAPMVGGLPHLREFATVMGFGDRTLGRLVTRLERRVGAPMSHFDVPELGRAVRMPPTLVIHDRDDRSTPVTDGAAIAAAWPGTRLHVTSGLGHNRLLRSPEVVAEVVSFVSSTA